MSEIGRNDYSRPAAASPSSEKSANEVSLDICEKESFAESGTFRSMKVYDK